MAEAPGEAGAYGFGRLRWIGGANSGLESAIAASEGPQLRLQEPPPFAIALGDMVEIVEGCDKSFATCRGRFANAENFRASRCREGLLTRIRERDMSLEESHRAAGRRWSERSGSRGATQAGAGLVAPRRRRRRCLRRLRSDYTRAPALAAIEQDCSTW